MLSARELCLVFDVGGTTLRAGLYDPGAGQLRRRTSRPTPNRWRRGDAGLDDLYRILFTEMRSMGEELEGDHARIAVAFPGPVAGDGQVLRTPTIHGDLARQPFPLAARARASWPDADIVVLNDVTAAGYAAVADGLRDFCIVTVSSGVGNKLFLDGAPALGAGGRGGEIGHWRVSGAPDAPICDCGEPGHLGAIASGRGVLELARRRAAADPRGFASSRLGGLAGGEVGAIDNPAIVGAFHAQDPWTTAIIRDAAGRLAEALALVHAATGVECFLIFGGFADALGGDYLRLLADEARARCWQLGQDWAAMIRPGRFADDAGLIGAGYFACHRGARS